MVSVDDQHVIGIWNRWLLAIWQKRTELQAVRKARLALRGLVSRYSDGVALIQVIETTAIPPGATVRRELAAFLADGENSVLGSSVVHEGTGFMAATFRGVVTAVTVLSKPKYPHVIHASVAETAAWHIRTLGTIPDKPSPEELMAVVAELRSQPGAWSAASRATDL